MKSKLQWTGERLVTSVFEGLTVEHLARYGFCLPMAKGKTVLDIACGEGYGSNLLASEAASVTGADVSSEAVDHAQATYKNNKLKFVTADGANLPFADGSFDMVVSFETIEHLTEQEKMIAEIKRVLKPDGLLVVSTPNKSFNPNSELENPFHHKELTEEEFIGLLKSSFANVTMFAQQNFHGSVIYPLHGPWENVREVTGDFAQIRPSQTLATPGFFLAVASASEVVLNEGYFFTGADVYEQGKAAIRKTWTYRIGAAAVSPLKWLKSFASKQG